MFAAPALSPASDVELPPCGEAWAGAVLFTHLNIYMMTDFGVCAKARFWQSSARHLRGVGSAGSSRVASACPIAMSPTTCNLGFVIPPRASALRGINQQSAGEGCETYHSHCFEIDPSGAVLAAVGRQAVKAFGPILLWL